MKNDRFHWYGITLGHLYFAYNITIAYNIAIAISFSLLSTFPWFSETSSRLAALFWSILVVGPTFRAGVPFDWLRYISYDPSHPVARPCDYHVAVE